MLLRCSWLTKLSHNGDMPRSTTEWRRGAPQLRQAPWSMAAGHSAVLPGRCVATSCVASISSSGPAMHAAAGLSWMRSLRHARQVPRSRSPVSGGRSPTEGSRRFRSRYRPWPRRGTGCGEGEELVVLAVYHLPGLTHALFHHPGHALAVPHEREKPLLEAGEVELVESDQVRVLARKTH